jgi:hypothetical protein
VLDLVVNCDLEFPWQRGYMHPLLMLHMIALDRKPLSLLSKSWTAIAEFVNLSTGLESTVAHARLNIFSSFRGVLEPKFLFERARTIVVA